MRFPFAFVTFIQKIMMMPSVALKDFYVPAKKNINILRSHPGGTNLSTVNVTCILMGFSFSYHLDSLNNSIKSKRYLPQTLLLASMNVSALGGGNSDGLCHIAVLQAQHIMYGCMRYPGF